MQIIIFILSLTLISAVPDCHIYRKEPYGQLYYWNGKGYDGCSGSLPICWNKECFHNQTACVLTNETAQLTSNGECVRCRGYRQDGWMRFDGCMGGDVCMSETCGGYGVSPDYTPESCAGNETFGGQNGYNCQVTFWGAWLWIIGICCICALAAVFGGSD